MRSIDKAVINEKVVELMKNICNIMYEISKGGDDMGLMFDIGFLNGVRALSDKLKEYMDEENTL